MRDRAGNPKWIASPPSFRPMQLAEAKNRHPRKRVIVTTSWDDDANSGVKVSHLLADKGINGTFYVPTAQLGHVTRFSISDLRVLNENRFEIGAHTVSHRVLTGLSRPEIAVEVRECKSTLENILGSEVSMFCYPKGRYNPVVLNEVESAGYRGARTTLMLQSDSQFSRFEMPTTLQAYPHARANYARNLLRLSGLTGMLTSLPNVITFDNWLQLGRKLFDRVLHQGGIWHLYGHPWEIENLNLWAELDTMLEYISGRPEVNYLTNGDVVRTVGASARNASDIRTPLEYQA